MTANHGPIGIAQSVRDQRMPARAVGRARLRRDQGNAFLPQR
ncbi:hypothetical protein [Dyella flava]|nr:hypothetical protein [Dyella flava]